MRQREKKKAFNLKRLFWICHAIEYYYYNKVSLVCSLNSLQQQHQRTLSLLCFFLSFCMSLPPKNSSLFQEKKTEGFKNREPLLRFKKIMEMVKAVEREGKESYKYDFENMKEKNSSSQKVKRWNSSSALRVEDPDINDDTVSKRTAVSSVLPMLPFRPPEACEATGEELQEEAGKKKNICFNVSK